VTELHIAPIVEGHGEVGAVRILLDRIWRELLGGTWVNVLLPIRRPRGELVQRPGLLRAIDLAALKLNALPGNRSGLILVLLDSEGEPPCQLAPELLSHVREERGHLDVACVLANVEYETWFVAAAESLGDFLELGKNEPASLAPEGNRSGKLWVKNRFRGPKYSETLDQPRMTASMDLLLCRRRCPSFDKLCRELEKRRDL